MINEVILVGQMLDRPRLSKHPDGSPYTQFRVCVEDMYKEIEGKNHKNVVECVAYGYVSERICKFFHCGKYIKIYGALNSVQIRNRGQRCSHLSGSCLGKKYRIFSFIQVLAKSRRL